MDIAGLGMKLAEFGQCSGAANCADASKPGCSPWLLCAAELVEHEILIDIVYAFMYFMIYACSYISENKDSYRFYAVGMVGLS